MKKIVNHVRSSSHVRFILSGILILLATFAIVAASAPLAQDDAESQDEIAAEQGVPEADTSVAPDEKFQPTRIVGEGVGSWGVQGAYEPAEVPSVITANPLINNNTGSTGAASGVGSK